MDPLARLARDRLGTAPGGPVTPDPRHPVRTMPDGSPCWCLSVEEPHEGWVHSPVCMSIRAPVHPHTLLASPKGRDCVTYLDLGPDHVALETCPCRPNLVRCGDEAVWLHQRLEDEGVRIGDELP